MSMPLARMICSHVVRAMATARLETDEFEVVTGAVTIIPFPRQTQGVRCGCGSQPGSFVMRTAFQALTGTPSTRDAQQPEPHTKTGESGIDGLTTDVGPSAKPVFSRRRGKTIQIGAIRIAGEGTSSGSGRESV